MIKNFKKIVNNPLYKGATISLDKNGQIYDMDPRVCFDFFKGQPMSDKGLVPGDYDVFLTQANALKKEEEA